MLSWSVEIRNSSLARVGQLSENDLTDFVCVPRMNNLGSWSIKLPNTVLNDQGVRVPHALCAVLRTQGSGVIVTGPNGVVLTGPMTFAELEATAEDEQGSWLIEGTSDAVILARPVAYPQPSNSNPATQSVSNDVRTGLGEALMRAYVSANIGPTASTARKLSDLTLSADGGRGISLSKSPRFQNLLELTQEIAVGSSLLFDVVQVGAGRQFQVSAPVDVSAAVRWDIANNQLSRSKYGYSAPGCTRVFVAGQGEGTARTIVEVTTAASLLSEAIWGRIERFVDQRNTNDMTELTQAGLEVLTAEGSTVTSLEVVPSSDMADGFGVTWFLGSWVTIVVNDQEVRAQIVEVPISISADGVLIGAVVGDATGFDWESILSAKQAKTESRVSALEANAEITAAPKSPNYLINGGMDIWQRGTSSGYYNGYGSVDRWYHNSSASVTYARDTTLPVAGCQYSLKATVGASAASVQFFQAIETLNALPFAGQTVTLSAYVATSSSAPVSLVIEYSTAVDTALGGAWTALVSAASPTTAAMSKIFCTANIPATAKSIRVSVLSSLAAAATINVTGVQLEIGSVATPFHRNAPSIQAELAACQRYYYRQTGDATATFMPTGGAGDANATTNGYYHFHHPTPMRIPPTSIEWSGLGFAPYGVGSVAISALTIMVAYSTKLVSLTNFSGTGFTVGFGGILGMSSAAYLGFSAEL